MNVSLKQSALFLCTTLLLNAVAVSLATPVSAGVHEDAELAVARLQQNSATRAFADDMKSLELVVEIAHRYQANNDRENAEKFYLLALQKTRLIEALISTSEVRPAPETVASIPVVPESEPQQTPSTTPPLSLPAPVEKPVTPDNGNATSVVAETADEAPVEQELTSSRLVGTKGFYTVVKGDTIRLVAAKLGVSQQHLRSMNELDAKAKLKVGQKLAYNNRKIIPLQLNDGIIVNIPDRTLYYFQRGALVTSLPVAVGSPTKNDKYIWQTPTGKFKITAKVKDPTWTVPPSIQSEMEEQGKDVLTVLPPGPDNPLGKYAIRTSIPGIMIHSTTKPASIYSFSSHGCIRLSPDTMEEFFPRVRVNTRGEIIYKPVKLVVIENGRVFMEVHRDIYSKSTNLLDEARQMIDKLKVADQVDWDKIRRVMKQKSGIAEDISL